MLLWWGMAANAGALDVALDAIGDPGAARHEARVVRFAGGHRVLLDPVVDGRPVAGARRVVAVDPRGTIRRVAGAEVLDERWPDVTLGPELAVAAAEGATAWLGRGAMWAPRTSEAWLLQAGELVPATAVAP